MVEKTNDHDNERNQHNHHNHRDRDGRENTELGDLPGGPDIEIVPPNESTPPPHDTCSSCGLKLRDDNYGEECMLCRDR